MILSLARQDDFQPQGIRSINWSNPLASGVVFASFPGEGGNVSRDLVTGIQGTLTGAAVPGTVMGLKGKSRIWNGGASEAADRWADANLKSFQKPVNNATWAVYARRIGNQQFYAALFDKRYGSTNPYSAFSVVVNRAAVGNNVVTVGVGTSTATSETSIDYAATDLTVPHVSMGRFTGEATKLDLIFNGIQRGTATTPGSTILHGNQALSIGASGEVGTAANFAGEIYLCVLWNRALSDTEAFSFANNPWQLLNPLAGLQGSSSSSIKVLSSSGSVIFTGAVPLLRTRKSLASGTINLSGAAIEARLRTLIASGQIQFSGEQPIKHVKVSTVSGTIVFYGSASVTFVPITGTVGGRNLLTLLGVGS